MLNVTLPPDIENLLRAKAEILGISPENLALQVLQSEMDRLKTEMSSSDSIMATEGESPRETQ